MDWGKVVKNFAQNVAIGQNPEAYQAAIREKRVAEQQANEQARLDELMGWQREDRPMEVAGKQRKSEAEIFANEQARVEAERRAKEFGHNESEWTRKDEERKKEVDLARENLKRTMPGVSPQFLDSITSLEDLSKIQQIATAKANEDYAKAHANLAKAQTEAGGFNPNTGRSTRRPVWGIDQEAKLATARRQLQKSVQDGVLTQAQAEAQWAQIDEAAQAQKKAAEDAAQAGLMTPGGANVNAGSLPAGNVSEPPYYLRRR